uniref:DB module n=1 Tax=Trichuris muris TaxID=70415 RepID=A0A5S6QQU3_TRIMR
MTTPSGLWPLYRSIGPIIFWLLLTRGSTGTFGVNGRGLTDSSKGSQGCIPDTTKCCQSKGVSQLCVRKLCDYRRPPNEFEVFEVASECPHSLTAIASCLADQRDHMPCCSRRAKGADDLLCLHLCNGSKTTVDLNRWEEYKAYVACLSFNIQPMYQCFAEGYRKSPYPPVNLTAVSVGQRSAHLQWKPPLALSSLVKKYRVQCRSSDMLFLKEGHTSSTFLLIDDLLPNTKYAITVTAEGEDFTARSLPSDEITIVTKGLTPEVEAYQEEMETADGFTQTLACRIKVHGRRQSVPSVQWVRRWTKGENFHPIASQGDLSKSYSADIFLSSVEATWLLYTTTLTIYSVRATDYALYKCQVRTEDGEDTKEIRLRPLHTIHIPRSPPNITKCCLKEQLEGACLATCKGSSLDLDFAGLFLADFQVHKCSNELSKMVHCSLGAISYGPCCLRRKVPQVCMALCDGTLKLPTAADSYASCLPYLSSVMECHMESRALIPSPPDNLRLVTSNQVSTVIIEWSEVVDAKLYIVYYRIVGEGARDEWERKTSTANVIVLNRLPQQTRFEVVVLAASLAGSSEPSRSLFFSTMPRSN